MAIEIPSRLHEALEAASALEGAVKLSLDALEPLLKDNKLVFFPEYTDHGIEHIEGVMRTAEALIQDQAWEVVTAADAATLILACLVHDIAMHLARDGFVSLVTQNKGWRIQPVFEDKPWDVLWADFVAEAKRFDGRTLTALFGSPDPVKAPGVTTPEPWGERQLKLVGEFIRRHHHRLAHQIALNGMPGPESERLRLQACDKDMADIAGLVARSHGMSLRGCIPYLEDRYHARREHRGIHAVFLMTVLRVADYLQVEAERAPKELLKVRQLRSPVSQGEWRAHDAVKDIKSTEEDIESLYIHALPNDVGTYLRLKELLAGIQSELDTSWAVLGEVYSRYTKEKLDSLGLSIRRVTSNLDDEEAFAESVPYVPCHAVFETAGAELMKLLVEPLYGDNPYIGVRELLQNAVDAVRELDELLRMRDDLKDIERPAQDADVVITLKQEDDGSFWLVVSDRGIGMTADTIRNYFLKAGACIRKSVGWRRTFEDEAGSARVLRSGRFGIGVFAAFLLGQQIHVSTRHPDREYGIEFEASIDNEFIEMRKVSREVGTTIKVGLNEETVLRLLADTEAWDWYVLVEPSVRRTIDIMDVTPLLVYSKRLRKKAEKGIMDQSLNWPGPCSSLPRMWHRINHDGYQDIHWTYPPHRSEPRFRRISLACNGIIIGSSGRSNRLANFSSADLRTPLNQLMPKYIKFAPPSCSCFDPDGILPLNLQRNVLTQVYPFLDDLRDSILKDLLAYMLVMAPTTPINDVSSLRCYLKADYPGIAWDGFPGLDDFRFLSVVGTPAGVTLFDPFLLRKTLTDSVVAFTLTRHLLGEPESLAEGLCSLLLEQNPVVAISLSHVVTTRPRSTPVCCLLESLSDVAPLAGIRLVLGRRHWERALEQCLQGISWRIVRADLPSSSETPELHGEAAVFDKCVVLFLGRCPESGVDLHLLTAQVNGTWRLGEPLVIAECFFEDTEPRAVEPSAISQYWMDTFGVPAIPYDPVERQEKLSHAYERLGEYVEAWEAVKLGET